MNYKLTDIVYEIGQFFVIRTDYGFEIYQNEGCASKRVARCGYKGQKGLDWVRAEILRRQNNV